MSVFSGAEKELEKRERSLQERERTLTERESILLRQETNRRHIDQLSAHFNYEIEINAAGQLEFPWKAGSVTPIAGYSLDEARGGDWSQLIHRDDRAAVWALLMRALREGYADAEYRVAGKSGETHWLKNSVQKVEQNGRAYLLGIVRDITDVRLTRQALVDIEASFESLFRSAPVVMIISSLDDGRLVDINDRFVAVVGYSRDEAIGKTATELGLWGSAEQRDDFREIREEREGTFEGIEAHLLIKSGEAVVALLSAEVITLHGQQCALWHAVDITNRKRVERELEGYRTNLEELVAKRTNELERSRHQLRHSERLASMGTLAAGIAHQINNPVGVILAASQHALDCEGDDDAADIWRKALLESEAQAKRCANIVRSVLQFSRDEPSAKQPENLRGSLRRAYRLTQRYAQERGASLNLQAGGDAITVSMNTVEIEQVLVNILRNAVESRERGTAVRISIEADEKCAWVSVRDDGKGIPEDDLSRVFDPFFTTRLGDGGTGLGLSVAHGIVMDHEGRMEVTNLETGGCCVRIELPLASDPKG